MLVIAAIAFIGSTKVAHAPDHELTQEDTERAEEIEEQYQGAAIDAIASEVCALCDAAMTIQAWSEGNFNPLDILSIIPVIPSRFKKSLPSTKDNPRYLEEGNIKQPTTKKGPIPDELPNNLIEKLALDEAKSGIGIEIIRNLGDEPRLIANYGPGVWVKMEHVHRSLDGKTITIHWFRNTTTGQDFEFKFTKRLADN